MRGAVVLTLLAFVCTSASCSHVVITSANATSCIQTSPAVESPAGPVSGPPPSPASSSTEPQSQCEPEPTGLVYSLPKGEVLLAAYRRKVAQSDITPLEQQVASDEQLVAKDNSTLSAAKATQQKDLAAAATTDTQKAQDQAAVATAKASLDADKMTLKAANDTLSEKKAAVGKKWFEAFSLTQLPIQPDPTARFVANLSHLSTRDDNMQLSLTNGLLSATTTQSTDQTPTIIQNLAQSAVSVATLLAGGVPIVPSASTREIQSTEQVQCEYNIAIPFDPTESDINSTLQNQLKGYNPHFTLSVLNPADSEKANHIGRSAGSTSVDGLVYRAPIGVVISITPDMNAVTDKTCPLSSLPTAQTMSLVVPDSRIDYTAPTDAGPFTASTFQYNFNNGMLTNYNVTRPSEVAAVANVPVQLVNDVMSIPTSILQFRLNYATAQANLATQQAARLQAQSNEAVAVVSAQTALENARSTLADTAINNETARTNAINALVQAEQTLKTSIAAAAATSTTNGSANPTQP